MEVILKIQYLLVLERILYTEEMAMITFMVIQVMTGSSEIMEKIH